jgi:dihydropteroate synthase
MTPAILSLNARPALRRLQELLETARRGERTLLMAVLNVTPDSFSDGGLYFDPEKAVAHAAQMLADGADILDIGGESTRPATFATQTPLPPDEELNRIRPVIEAIAKNFPDAPISVDTYKASVATGALQAGAVMINDISALRADAQMAGVAAQFGVPVCLMHLLGLPMAIPTEPNYTDVTREVKEHLRERAEFARAAGISEYNIILDPGIGFGKNVSQNLELLRRLRELTEIGCPLLVGTSRKSTIGKVLGGLAVGDRIEGTAATVAISIANGAAIVRVHDVKEMARVIRMSDAIVRR